MVRRNRRNPNQVDELPEFYLKTMEAHKPLEAEVEVRATPEDLVRHNLRLVLWIAKGFQGLGMPFEDLVSFGNVGLVVASQRYDSSKGVKFATYARWWVERSIIDGIRRERRNVRLPVNLQRAQEALARIEDRLLQGRRVVDDQLVAGELGCRPRRAEALRGLMSREVRLDSEVGAGRHGPHSQGGRRLLESLVDDSPAPDADFEVREADGKLRSALSALPDQQAYIIFHSYGFDEESGGEGEPLATIGRHLGLSRERVRQIRVKAIGRLRKALSSMGFKPEAA